MAQALKDSFLDLERHRQLLDANIEKLRKSLKYWRTWEAEYEGLKEEILSIGPAPSHEQLVAIGRAYDSEFVTQKEVEDILGVKIPRSADQVTNILSRRIDYVSQNVRTVEKQLEAAEHKLAAATVISQPDVRNEEGLPLTEIIEELDEKGNIVSVRTETQGSARGQLLEVLEKAGVKDLPRVDQEQSRKSGPAENTPNEKAEDEMEAISKSSETPRKSVQFAEGTKLGPETQKSQTARRIEAVMNSTKRQDSEPARSPMMPLYESPEDAALRKEMLQYGMSEIGAVVAELDLEEGSDFTDDDYDDEDASSMEDDEDSFGRSTMKVVDEEMHQRMIELEKKLGLRMMENVGPNPDVDLGHGGVGDMSSKLENSDEQAASKETRPAKKGVRFAEELDVAAAPEAAPKVSELKSKLPSKSPVGDIVERTASKQKPMTAPIPTQKVSQFKSARAAKGPPQPSMSLTNGGLPNPQSPSPTKPTFSEGKTLADSIIERDVPINVPLEPDEFDPALQQQQVATEYHRIRNRMVQKQGGFLKNEDETGIIPLTEEEGGPKRVSRFKAARLARS